MSTAILNGIPKPLKKYLKNLDDYDDPVFILIRVDQDVEPFVKKIDTAIESVEPYSTVTLLIENDLYFASVDCEQDVLISLVNSVQDTLVASEAKSHIAAFRHNCLGKAKDTFEWCCMLLEEVQEGGSGYLVNDFKDRATWPGIDKYMKRSA